VESPKPGSSRTVADGRRRYFSNNLYPETDKIAAPLAALIPLELSRLVDPEFSGLVRYIAGRYLARTDDGSAEGLYVRELAQEVATRPSGAIA